MSGSLAKVLADVSALDSLDDASGVALGHFSLSKGTDFDAALAVIKRHVTEVEAVLGDGQAGDGQAAKAFVLAATNASVTREILDKIIELAAKAKKDGSEPRQSSLFRVLEVEAECRALSSLLLRAMKLKFSGAQAVVDSFSAFLASQDLIQGTSALLCALELQEPESIAGSELSSLSLCMKLNRATDSEGTLSLAAVESEASKLRLFA